MSAQQVQKLEALLQRVQQNRGKPRTDGGAVAPAAPVARVSAPAAAPTPSRRPRESKPSPLEQAVARSARPERPATAPTPIDRPRPQPKPAPKKPAPPKPKPTPAVAQPAPPAPAPAPAPEPARAAGPDPVTPQQAAPPSQPIVAVTGGDAVPTAPATFGELLARTLALTPR